ncbi:RICIN domain-containing protein [Kitasatospora griseola]|uniref:RICIN domain-containing protein n=1 Tax=Kitasatospora griseola TaxID=2064 RepID=UPI0036605D7E
MTRRTGLGRLFTAAGVAGALTVALSLTSTGSASAASDFQGNLKSNATNRCLAVDGGGNGNGTPVFQWDCNGNNDQQWTFENTGGGAYEIVNKWGLCLEAPGWTTAAGAQLGQWGCHGGANQTFYIDNYMTDGTNLRFRNVNSGLCVSVSGGSAALRTPIIQWYCNDAADQRWHTN